ncbi:MAG: substrate-binding domain-containing protein [Planctomycetota bacterium]|nr:substrate-binding domain-containing protein [Planctomycetota bacterium]MDA1141751.1 substrate-binding domain-containing protein [Planctomycetota bacterium]
MRKAKDLKPAISQQGETTLLLSLENPDEGLMHGILDVAHELEWSVIDLRYYGGEIPPRISPGGAIVDSSARIGSPLIRDLQAANCPIVGIGRGAAGVLGDIPGIPMVMVDQEAIGKLAADHFLERGFRHLAYIGHDPWAGARRVYKSFEQRTHDRGQTCHLLRYKSENPTAARRSKRQRQFEKWIRTIPVPVGILAYHDIMAGTICAMCRIAELSVPEEVAVLGLGNSRLQCECAPITLSSIDQDHHRQGAEAVRLLEKLMSGEPGPDAPVLIRPKGVEVRRSTDVLAVSDPIVASALRFIWDNLHSSINVDDIAREAHVSRRKLERRFRREVGRTVNKELLRKRLERCCELLVTTDTSVTAMAPEIGFASKHYLHRAFRKAFGMSPREYRLLHEVRAWLPVLGQVDLKR